MKTPIKKPKIQVIGADYKDTDEIFDQLKKILRKFGLHMIDDPMAEGSDETSFIISDKKLTKKEIKEYLKSHPLYEEEDDFTEEDNYLMNNQFKGR